ncbi:hypothetical protein RKE30_39025 [Streptomyces sp. Li-HN-5-11]|uniref:hypothetical protein n=1 Tax=Streptomyces sp. Li-HN-5-11 TaxID=3075432 RepID=UPI0028AD660E|nr:hypothetical protein [Streptomyces sp. Li-HN-5-11]WNM35923.1 hypothetical protein RKE30_39025 [Streptomyces sp. Li-HN-5-11]
MRIRGRRLRFTAAVAIVMLALTGFSRSHGHSRHSSHTGGGGGCSSSRQDHDTSSSSSSSSRSSSSGSGGSYGSGYNRRPTHRPTSTPSGGTASQGLSPGTARLVSCATKQAPYATVEVRNPNSRKVTFSVTVDFMGAGTVPLEVHVQTVSVPAEGRNTVKVRLDDTHHVDQLDHCTVDPDAVPAG